MNSLYFNHAMEDNEIIDLFSAESTDIDSFELQIKGITFPTKHDAEEYLEDILKIYPAVAIKYLEPLEDFESSELYQGLVDKLNVAIKNYLEFPESMVKKLAEQKSGTKGCTACKSSVNRDFFIKKTETRLLNIIETSEEQKLGLEDFLAFKMKAISCPICDDDKFVVTETDENKLKVLRNKITEAEKKLKEEEMAFQIKSGQKTVGIIGYRD